MNTFSKMSVILLALSILAIPAMAVEEEEHLILVKSDPNNPDIVYMTQITIPGHEEIPEHAELRPFFRDSDPEFAVAETDATSYPVENVVISKETATPDSPVDITSYEKGEKYEYAAIP